jgi:biotin carboxyl carrier protein
VRLDWTEGGETCHFRLESEEERVAEVRNVEPGVYLILSAGRSFEVRVDGSTVSVGGRTFEFEVVDPRRWNRERGGSHSEGRQNIAAAMPGKVVRVLVSEGDVVEAGQGLVVVEAMKMQNEMEAPRSGRVVALSVAPGATVSAGQILVAIE